ncbi:MAG: DEAD/DEAH box helicase, partial [Planctomycetaceae bacterium]|nr:DEAD/DEAH box helicase [Planctomycetaceae bacterium]
MKTKSKAAVLVADSSETERGSEEQTHSYRTAGGITVRFRTDLGEFGESLINGSRNHLQLHLTLAKLQLLRGFDELLCLDGLTSIEHLPHQIETVRKVLRRFRGRVLLADEVGLGKTIEACLLLREYLMRRLVRRVLILVPNPLVSQWHEELSGKFQLEFNVPPRTATSGRKEYWESHDRVLVSTSFARTGNRPDVISSVPWDLIIVDEAHHCRNRTTKLWKLINGLQRRHMFLLTATPVQNNLLELYSLLTLLEPGHLKTEADFKRQFVTKGNPRDPRNRRKLQELLGEVMVRNTRSLVQINLPPRYAQTIMATPAEEESQLLHDIQQYLRGLLISTAPVVQTAPSAESIVPETAAMETAADETRSDNSSDASFEETESGGSTKLSRMRLQSILTSLGSHPATAAAALQPLATNSDTAARLCERAVQLSCSAKDEQLLKLLADSRGHKVLVFVGLIRTLHRLTDMLTERGIAFSVFSGEQTSAEKDVAVEQLRANVDIMLCTDSAGEGRNLQFADTLINYDLPWNPMKVEQRIGRLDRYGQQSPVITVISFVLADTVEERILLRLYERIGVFHESIGELEPILGDVVAQIEQSVFSHELSAAEEIERANLIDQAIVNKQRDLEVLSSRMDEFLGVEDVLAEVKERISRGLTVTSADVRQGVEEVLREHGAKLRQRSGRLDVWEISRSPLLADTIDRWAHSSRTALPAEDSRFVADLRRGATSVVFDSEAAERYPNIPFIRLGHPLARLAVEASLMARAARPAETIYRIAMSEPPFRGEQALLTVFRFNFTGANPGSRLFPLVIHDSGFESEDVAWSTFSAIRGDLLRGRGSPDWPTVEDWLDASERTAASHRDAMLADFRSRNDAALVARRASITGHRARQIAFHEDQANRARNMRIVALHRGAANNRREDLDRELRQMGALAEVQVSFELVLSVLIEGDEATDPQSAARDPWEGISQGGAPDPKALDDPFGLGVRLATAT